MSLVAAVIARLRATVPDLRTIDGAAALAALIERNAIAQVTPAAHVIPSGLKGLAAEAMTGAFVQDVEETVTVVLSLRPNDRIGAAGIEPVEALKTAVIAAIAGWAPGDETGVFVLSRAGISNVSGGALIFQIDFAIHDQLRILA